MTRLGKKNAKLGAAALMAGVMMAITVINALVVLNTMRKQTMEIGSYQLSTMSGKLETTLGDAEAVTMELAMEAQTFDPDSQELADFIYDEKSNLIREEIGAYNVYVAGNGWDIIPDLEKTPDYVATERSWYTGALKNNGKPYITEPYVDAATGDICYTVSVLFPDKVTVLGVDYTTENMQRHIKELSYNGLKNAVIVTDDGIIAGCYDDSLIGKDLNTSIPDYAGIFSLVKSSTAGEVVNARIKSDRLYDTLFATKAGMGWYILVYLSEWEMYRTYYIQIFSTIGAAAILLVGFLVVLLFSRHSQAAGAAEKQKKPQLLGKHEMDVRFRNLILLMLVVSMGISLYVNIATTFKWGNARMKQDVQEYDYQLSQWVTSQKSILDMFCSVISTNPEMLKDYDGTIRYLDSITKQYPEISVTYLANPKLEPTVYMNNGWLPEDDWKVEERQWYKDLMNSEEGWIISDPYYDEQTGLYCVTLAETVRDARTGEFLGNFGIDFYMDKLTDILGNSYNDEGYAFLADAAGDIINHPFGSYQMSYDNTENISNLPYGTIRTDGSTTLLFRDYDNVNKILIATRDETTGFRIFVVRDFWMIYGVVILYAFSCIAIFIFCLVVIYRLLTNLIRWQNEAKHKIQEAADAAIAAGEAKSAFLAQMSHEIRTPINAVLGMNEMILRETADDNILEYADNIKSAGNTLLTLINSILDFSKIEDGKMELTPVRYELASMVNDLVISITERVRQKELRFFVDVDEKLPSVLFGDDVRVSQIIMNLLTNAVKYTDQGEIRLSIKCGKVTSYGKVLISVAVSDTGIGIREDEIDKMFESFERLDTTRNRNIEGTGLGMSIVTKLLEMMGSVLNVESVYGRGSTFSFDLIQDVADPTPIGDYEKQLAAVSKERDVKKTIYAPSARVLVVDDNDMNLKVARSLLRLCGIKPTLCSSGFETLNLMENEVYDIVFLDHMMPKMDGIETLDELRKRSLIPVKTTMIVLTANAVVGAKEEYLERGFDDYLSKPIDLDDLQDKLSTYLPERAYEEPEEQKDAGDEAKADVVPAEGESVLEFTPGQEVSTDGAYDLKKLESFGIDTAAGIRYCAEDPQMYFEILDDYTDEYDEKREGLEENYKNKDWKEYQVLIHAVKSTSKTMGIHDLYEQTLALELAAKSEDAIFIDENHEKTMEKYKEVTEYIRSCKK
ncbi:MAG: response regulator [Lachnospiraceae bacterium]|nr:response regulator [Lachnospiraceae bacterium]